HGQPPALEALLLPAPLATLSPGAGCEGGSGDARGPDAGAPGAGAGTASPGLSPTGAAGAGLFTGGTPKRCRNSAIQPLTGLSSPVRGWCCSEAGRAPAGA